ncbi:MAG: DNA polymerase I [Campylobacter gracilis]|uniref:DNA polymerase I n=1 Tax=Campylobacter gracilis TaxID=824 RepID=UPI0026F1CC47|nr:DNA polymerase I [Campylobacter gracilis]MBS6152180.1 DNA polymerase I [Campylobacter gracilis]
MQTITIIDTFGFFFRLYYAMSGLKTKDGKPSGMVSGFASFIANLSKEFKSDYIIFALDSKGKTFRSDIDPNYKTNRQAPPPALLQQLPVCIEMIEKMGLYSLGCEGYEADDLIASVVKKYGATHKINIVTSDKDLYQLIGENVKIYSHGKKMLYGREECLQRYGVYPEQIVDFLAICGDSADNIPGVRGIGDKGAKKLLDEWGSLDEIYSNLDRLPQNKQREYLIEGKQSAYISKRLATLYDELEIPPLEDAKFPQQNPLFKIREILKDYALNRLLSALSLQEQNGLDLWGEGKGAGGKSSVLSGGGKGAGAEPSRGGSILGAAVGGLDGQNSIPGGSACGGQSCESAFKTPFEPICITDAAELARLCEGIGADTLVSFDTETTSIDSKSAKIVGFSFAFNEERAYYVPLAHSYLGAPAQISSYAAKAAIEALFRGYVVGQNLKYDFEIVKNNFNIEPPACFADTMVLAWLLDPANAVGMDSISPRYLGYETVHFGDVVKKGETFASVELDAATIYASEDAWVTLRLYFKLKQLLEPALFKLAQELEFPFVRVLWQMQRCGIKIDVEMIKRLIERNERSLRALTDEIYELCGEQFNINSPAQLGAVLFERLGLPAAKRTKTGYSTDESVLKDLTALHPAVGKILDYRELFKLQSTYCEPLLQLALADPQNRVRSNFLQTGTATGRLASKNPNLQNIPARGTFAKDVRDCFLADEGYSLISLDYSQIELRLLAHFSRDPALLAAFRADEDIHARTAISIFGDAQPAHRTIAKSINFGLIYGMGAGKLSDSLGIARAEAKGYIERYFAAFCTIKEFLQSIKSDAKADGYVSTLFGRRRYFDFANARNNMVYASYEREAVNTKFQGSAADIIKKAMVEISPLLNDEARLILQIHDELIFEVRDDLAQSFGARAQEIMQSAASLNVPLKTSLNIAKRWGELK